MLVAVSGQDLYEIVWTAVRMLKEIGLEIILVVADGVGNNGKFFKLHRSNDCMKDVVIYEVKNIYDPSKYGPCEFGFLYVWCC